MEEENQEVVNTEKNINPWKVVDENAPVEDVVKLYGENKGEEEVVVTDPPADTPIDPPAVVVEEEKELDEEKVLEFIRNKKGIEANSFDDLKPKEVLEVDDETKKYLEYKKETGRGYQDFLETQKDWTKEPKENVLRVLMKTEKPYLSDSDIDLLIEDKYGIEELDEFATDSERKANRLKEIALEDDYQKGITLLESQKEKYKVSRGSDESIPQEYRQAKELVDNYNKQQEENKVVFEKQRQDFLAKTESVFTKDFEGFKVSALGQEFKIKPENIDEAKATLSNLETFDKKFFDENGTLKDPSGYYKALYFAHNPDKVAEHYINIGKAMQAEEDEKASKNIQVVGTKNIQTPLENNGKTWTVVKD